MPDIDIYLNSGFEGCSWYIAYFIERRLSTRGVAPLIEYAFVEASQPILFKKSVKSAFAVDENIEAEWKLSHAPSFFVLSVLSKR